MRRLVQCFNAQKWAEAFGKDSFDTKGKNGEKYGVSPSLFSGGMLTYVHTFCEF